MPGKAYLLLLATMLFWAGNAVAGKLAVGHVSPMILNLARWGFMLAVLLVIGRQPLARDRAAVRRHWRFLLFTGALGFTGFSVAMYSALLYTSATNVSIEQGASRCSCSWPPTFCFAPAPGSGRSPASHFPSPASSSPPPTATSTRCSTSR